MIIKLLEVSEFKHLKYYDFINLLINVYYLFRQKVEYGVS